MVRFLVMYDKPANPESFDRHYHEVHVPMAKQLPGLLSYTVSRQPTPVRGGEPYYLVAELDWADREALQAAFSSELGKATAQDLANFAPTGVRSMIFDVEDA